MTTNTHIWGASGKLEVKVGAFLHERAIKSALNIFTISLFANFFAISVQWTILGCFGNVEKLLSSLSKFGRVHNELFLHQQSLVFKNSLKILAI